MMCCAEPGGDEHDLVHRCSHIVVTPCRSRTQLTAHHPVPLPNARAAVPAQMPGASISIEHYLECRGWIEQLPMYSHDKLSCLTVCWGIAVISFRLTRVRLG